ncbi:transposase domain-containing protein [Roseateles sp. YR242]|nr:transposase domain-containing protein [Roseateles sp. YR242]
MSRIQSAKLDGLDPHVYLRDAIEMLPPQPASRVAQLPSCRWTPFGWMN